MRQLSSTVRILDLDGSVTAQTELLASLGTDKVEIVDLREMGPKLRYLATRANVRDFEQRVIHRESRDRLTLYGSGDFHHLSASLLRAFSDTPLSLVVFDTHPDWDRSSPWPCCGSWILDALRMPNIQKIVMIGLGAVDLTGYHINVGRIPELRTGRVAFYPFSHPYSLAWGRFSGEVDCATFRPQGASTRIEWRTVVEALPDWNGFLDTIFRDLPTDDVYLSIDKDCLREEDALTNWETGGLSTEQITQAIELLATRRNIIGADITGEYSPITIANPIFRWLSASDHPPLIISPDPANLARNTETNSALCCAVKGDAER